MSIEKIIVYTNTARLKNLFENVAYNLPLVGSELRVVVAMDGSRYWHRQGVLHREHGPAAELADGTRRWYKNGVPHRVNGPAIERPDGFRSWWQDGVLHRLDGPAIEHHGGARYWYVNGKKVPEPTPTDLS